LPYGSSATKCGRGGLPRTSKAKGNDITQKAYNADKAFEQFSDDEIDKEFLQFFTLVCTLIFDVYLKKNLIENLIDDYASRHTPKDTKGKKTSKKKE
jgi:hypothetical protein